MELRLFFKSKISLLLLLILSVCTCLCGTTDNSLRSYPVFSLRSKIVACKGTDSPELFYNKVALPSVTSLLDEGKIFFGVLMDRLESSLAGVEKFETLEKEWTYLLNVITQSFDLSIGRIQAAWDLVIDQHDTVLLPWEHRISRFVLLDLFFNLQNEYQVVEAVVRAGTKELMSTLQEYLTDIMEKLEDSIFTANEGEPKTEQEVIRRMEKALKTLEPNFIGQLVKRILQKMRGQQQQPLITTISFLKEPIEEIALTVEAFTTRGHQYPTFWADMTNILGVNNRSSSEELLHHYMTNDEYIINSVLALLTSNLS